MRDNGLVIGPYLYPPAACNDYDPRAPDVARRVADFSTSCLPAVTVEHIGSTSVPGCAGKGVIDLMILYPPGRLDDVKWVLADLGFQPQPNKNPHPESRPCRVGTVQHDGSTFRIHAHAIPPDSPEIERQRTFRDRLRTDPRLVAAYGAQAGSDCRRTHRCGRLQRGERAIHPAGIAWRDALMTGRPGVLTLQPSYSFLACS
jgi:GrpB-like predicted nucleotidyltransferase (UPF0157 family)